jgi:hypothetical protein
MASQPVYTTLGAVLLRNLYVRFCEVENAVRHLPISPDDRGCTIQMKADRLVLPNIQEANG